MTAPAAPGGWGLPTHSALVAFQCCVNVDQRCSKCGNSGENDGEDERQDEPAEPVEIDFANMERRVRRITMHSAPMSDFVVSNDGASNYLINGIADPTITLVRGCAYTFTVPTDRNSSAAISLFDRPAAIRRSTCISRSFISTF